MARHLPALLILTAAVITAGACTTQRAPAGAPVASATPATEARLWPSTLPTAYTVSTLAGSRQGSVDGSGDGAQFDYPSGIALERRGNLIVSEQGSTRIRRVTPDGQALTLTGGTEGYQDGPLPAARFAHPISVAIDPLGMIVVADAFGSHRLRRIDPATGVATLAGTGMAGRTDGTAAQATFDNPTGLAISGDGSTYIADANNHRIRRYHPDGRVSTVAGGDKGFADGWGKAAQFNNPTGIVIDTDGSLVVADTGNQRLRRVNPNGEVTTLAGAAASGKVDGLAADARFNSPIGLTIDGKRNIYIVDGFNHGIRALAPDGQVVTLAGSGEGVADGTGPQAKFGSPFGIAVDADGTLFVTDLGNHRIRRLRPDPM
jgi:sugar lactone lactonase YvrE